MYARVCINIYIYVYKIVHTIIVQPFGFAGKFAPLHYVHPYSGTLNPFVLSPKHPSRLSVSWGVVNQSTKYYFISVTDHPINTDAFEWSNEKKNDFEIVRIWLFKCFYHHLSQNRVQIFIWHTLVESWLLYRLLMFITY